jgi:1-acyl-sn-glycerol-3-phosphate acyltransferase
MNDVDARCDRPPVPQYLRAFVGWMLLALICLGWSVVALPACLLLPARPGTAFGRAGIRAGFRLYVWALQLLNLYHFDLKELDALRAESGVILAPNHPRLIDALVLLAYHPNAVCVMKTQIRKNLFLGAGSRLARYIVNTPPRRMIRQAIAALHEGGVLLLFPEGTRSRRSPVNECQLTVGAIAKHAQVPVLTVLIETDSPYLSKGWPLLRIPARPVRYRARLGRRFGPPSDAQLFTRELEAYFSRELGGFAPTEALQTSNALTGG